jgi:hypothetical protein
VSLRSVAEGNFVVIDIGGGKQTIIAEVDYTGAPGTVYEGAIYMVQSQPYQVERLDWTGRKAFVRKTRADYYTDAIDYTKLKILERFDRHGSSRQRRRPAHGEVHLVRRYPGYKKIRYYSHDNIGYGNIDLPDQEMHTTAVWWQVHPRVLEQALPSRERAIEGFPRRRLCAAPRRRAARHGRGAGPRAAPSATARGAGSRCSATTAAASCAGRTTRPWTAYPATASSRPCSCTTTTPAASACPRRCSMPRRPGRDALAWCRAAPASPAARPVSGRSCPATRGGRSRRSGWRLRFWRCSARRCFGEGRSRIDCRRIPTRRRIVQGLGHEQPARAPRPSPRWHARRRRGAAGGDEPRGAAASHRRGASRAAADSSTTGSITDASNRPSREPARAGIPAHQPLDEAQLARRLGAELVEPGVLRLVREQALTALHGRCSLEPEPAATAAFLSEAAPSPAFWAAIDTETSGLAGGTGTWVFTFGLGRWRAGKVELIQLLLTRLDAEAAFLRCVVAELKDVALLLSYNGMASVEQRLLGLSRGRDLPGSEAPAAWLDWLRAGNGDRLGGVLAHNRTDLLSVMALPAALARVYRSPGEFAADPARVASWHLGRNDVSTATAALQAGAELDADAQYLLGRLHARGGDWPAALTVWEPLALAGDAAAIEALAKFHEHRDRDPHRALYYARLLPAGPSQERRCARLRTKIRSAEDRLRQITPRQSQAGVELGPVSALR